jgi:hypothetical protein
MVPHPRFPDPVPIRRPGSDPLSGPAEDQRDVLADFAALLDAHLAGPEAVVEWLLDRIETGR